MILTTDDPDTDHELNQIIVVDDRYSGVYSNAEYTAWVKSVPGDISADDSTCKEFWRTNKVICGKGSSVDEAVAGLFKIIFDDDCPFKVFPKVIVLDLVYVSDHGFEEYVNIPYNDDIFGLSRLQDNYPITYRVFNKLWRGK